MQMKKKWQASVLILVMVGLLQNQNRLGGNVWLDFVDDPEKQNDIIVTSFGKTFYHNSPAALKRN